MLSFIKKYIYFPPAALFQTVVPVPPFRPITEGLSDGPPLLAKAFEGQGDLSGFLTNLFNIAISLGAILAVLRIGYAGFVYMTSDAAGEKSNAKQIIQNAVIGLLLLLGIVLILERINPDLLQLNLELQPTGTQAPAGGTGGFPQP